MSWTNGWILLVFWPSFTTCDPVMTWVPSIFLNQQWLSIWRMVIRVSWLLSSIRFTKSLASWDTWPQSSMSSKSNYCCTMFLEVWRLWCAKKGNRRVNITCKTIPKDHTSVLLVCGWFRIISGEQYARVPKLWVHFSCGSKTRASPKSIILATVFFSI